MCSGSCEGPNERRQNCRPLKQSSDSIFDGSASLPYGGAQRIVQAAPTLTNAQAAASAHHIRNSLPANGLFAGQSWKISPTPFPLGPSLAKEIESLGRVLLQFYRAVNLLYRKSAEGKMPEWVAHWLDLGKPAELIALQRSSGFKN